MSFTYSLTMCCVPRLPYMHTGDVGIHIALLLLAQFITMGQVILDLT